MRVSIAIEEGDRAKIRQVNIVGNTSFEDEEITEPSSSHRQLAVVHSQERPLLEDGARRRPREAALVLHGPRFRRLPWDDVQVAISPTSATSSSRSASRKAIATRSRDVKLAGEMVVPEEDLQSAHPRAARRHVLASGARRRARCSWACGSARTATRSREIRAVPELNKETKEAAITFFVDPRNRVYVRRINFNGADSVNDEVFRREMRQMEGGFLSNTLVDGRKVLLQRCRTSKKVEHETTPVPGSPDLVDVDFKIEEGLPGQFGGSLGFSETYGVTLGGNFVHSNFMGTGHASRSICAAASTRRSTT